MDSLPTQENILAEITLTNELVWKRRVHRNLIDDWLANFKGYVFDVQYEQSVALWLLSNFVYYNQDEVTHLCKVVYRDYLHRQIGADLTESVDERLNEVHSRTMFAALGKPGESGSMIMYLFRTANSIGVRDISQPNARQDYDSVVFVDDVALSKDDDSQAWLYLKDKIAEHPGRGVHLLTLIASEDAISFLGSKGVRVTNAITLTNACRTFHPDSYVFHLNADHRDRARKIAEYYGNMCYPDDPLGYSKGEYLFGIFYNTPDNTLPIIWSDLNGWKPIFPRHHKNYRRTNSNELGLFV